MRYLYKIIRVVFVILGIGFGAIAGRPLPIWKLLPMLLVGLGFLGGGCARVVYDRPGMTVKGLTSSPEVAIQVAANAEIARAEAYAIKRCADDPRSCIVGQWGFGGLDMPAGYTVAGMQAAGAPTKMAEFYKDVKKMQELLIKAVQANKCRKCVKAKVEKRRGK